jgi:hypothetical protein
MAYARGLRPCLALAHRTPTTKGIVNRVLAAFGNVSPGAFIVSVAIAAGLAMLIFRHATKHGSKHATAWGIATFLFAGLAIPIYFINYWLSTRQRY